MTTDIPAADGLAPDTLATDALSPDTPAPDLHALLARLDGAYAEATLRATRTDCAFFAAWCEEAGLHCLPASPETVAAFVEAEGERVGPDTIRRRLVSIMRLHKLARLPVPTGDEEVRLALRRIMRRKGRPRRQALGLDADLLEACLEATDRQTFVGKRDAALLLTLYDTLCRRSEIAALEVDDLHPTREGGYLARVNRSKTDIAGAGRYALVGPRAARAIEDWLTAAEIADGPVFRGIRNGIAHWAPMARSTVGTIVKAAAQRAGLPDEVVAGLTSHSGRVGHAQDMALAGHDHLAIMRAGGWKTIDVVARYVEAAELRRLVAGAYSVRSQDTLAQDKPLTRRGPGGAASGPGRGRGA